MKKLNLLIVLVLLAGLALSPNAVFAQKFSGYSSGTQVMNLTGTDATIIMNYYRADDGSGTSGLLADTVNDTILGNSSKTYFPAVSPFSGSVVVQSGQQLGAVVNVQNTAGTAMASYVGVDQGSTTVNIPLLMKGNGGVPYDTFFSVQNTDGGPSDANISIQYSDTVTPLVTTVKPNASKTFNQATETHTSKVFSATITSDKPIVVVVVQENAAKMLAYTAFRPDAAATDIVMPLVNINNGGIVTGIQIQNTTANSTDVTVSYTPSLAGTACTETQTIPGNSSKTFGLVPFSSSTPTSNCAAGVKFVGSAKVTGNTGGAALVGIVNQSKTLYAEAYGSFNPANATPKVVMPLIMDRNGGSAYSTGFSVMNVGSAQAYVKCTFTNSATVDASAYTPSQLLQPGEAMTPNQATAIGLRYVGSGQCTAYSDAGFTTVDNAAKLVAVVNEKGNPTADRFMVYEAINVAP